METPWKSERETLVPGIDENGCSVSFSAGVAEYRPGRTSEDLLRLADEALYEAKRQGRDRIVRASERPVFSV